MISVSFNDTIYDVIKSFKDKQTEAAFNGRAVKGFPAQLLKVARRKLAMVNAALTLDDLRSPPNNKLEALSKDRAGQHSIRVNDQFRICFIWTKDGAEQVEFTDYH